MASSLEILKLLASISTPIIVALVGYKLNTHLKNIDNTQWQNRKIVEKRLDIYDKVAPDLNLIFCFSMWVGYWKDISPPQMITAKRDLDKIVNIYRHLLSDKFYDHYNEFIKLNFRTFNDRGKDALIRSDISGPDGDRRRDSNYEWQEGYAQLFAAQDTPERQDIKSQYEKVMQELRACIGLGTGRKPEW